MVWKTGEGKTIATSRDKWSHFSMNKRSFSWNAGVSLTQWVKQSSVLGLYLECCQGAPWSALQTQLLSLAFSRIWCGHQHCQWSKNPTLERPLHEWCCLYAYSSSHTSQLKAGPQGRLTHAQEPENNDLAFSGIFTWSSKASLKIRTQWRLFLSIVTRCSWRARPNPPEYHFWSAWQPELVSVPPEQI